MARVSAILTAAGEWTRMGRPKPLLPWRGTTLVEHQVDMPYWRAGATRWSSCWDTPPTRLLRYSGATASVPVVNPDYRLGKTTSIKAGLAHVDPAASAILLLAVDQPRTASQS